MGNLPQHRREIGVDVVQVHHIGLEVVEQFGERFGDVAHAQGALQTVHFFAQTASELHFRGEVFLVGRVHRFGVLHGIHRHLVACREQQRFGVHHHHAVAASWIIKFIYQ